LAPAEHRRSGRLIEPSNRLTPVVFTGWIRYANTGRSGDQSFKFIGTQDFHGRAGELRYQTFDQAGTANDITVVSGDINGDLVADFEIAIVGIVQLSSGDFLL
jgi:hypothetical protein